MGTVTVFLQAIKSIRGSTGNMRVGLRLKAETQRHLIHTMSAYMLAYRKQSLPSQRSTTGRQVKTRFCSFDQNPFITYLLLS